METITSWHDSTILDRAWQFLEYPSDHLCTPVSFDQPRSTHESRLYLHKPPAWMNDREWMDSKLRSELLTQVSAEFRIAGLSTLSHRSACCLKRYLAWGMQLSAFCLPSIVFRAAAEGFEVLCPVFPSEFIGIQWDSWPDFVRALESFRVHFGLNSNRYLSFIYAFIVTYPVDFNRGSWAANLENTTLVSFLHACSSRLDH